MGIDVGIAVCYNNGMKKGMNMANIKTAISLQEPLFRQANDLAREMNISRSRLFVLALEDFIHRYQNRQILEKINRAYADGPDPEEIEWLTKMRPHHRRIAEGEE